MKKLKGGFGGRRQRVKFQRRGMNQTRTGTMLEGYGDIIPAMPAEITELRGGETIIAERLTGTRIVSMRIRSNAATRQLKTSDRAVNERTGDIYDITAIDGLDTNNPFLTIMAKSGAAEEDLTSDQPNGDVWALEGGFWNDKGVWDDARVWRTAA